jgi:putative membrane protein
MGAVLSGMLLHGVPTSVPFTWAWSIHPSVVLGTGFLGALYVYGLGPWRRRHAPAERPEPMRVAAFAASLVLLLVSLNGPVHDLSDSYLFWVHMVQHLVLTLVWPPLLLYGVPGWMLDPLLRRPIVRVPARVLTHPVAAGLLYNVTIAAWHLPVFYELMMEFHEIHIFSHLLFMATAVLMWWPVASQTAELPRLNPVKGMLYTFLVSIPMQVVAALIVFADDPLYRWYALSPRVPELGNLSAIDDQKAGGLLMWVPGNLYMFGAIALIFFRWVREEGDPEPAPRARTRTAVAQAGG